MENEYYGVIYKITNTINSKVYIGQTTQNPKKRWREHITRSKNDNKYSTAITKAINKYGVENFIFEVVELIQYKKDLNIKEEEYIKKFNSLCPNGYNILSKVWSVTHSKEVRNKISKYNKNKKHTNSTSRYFGVMYNKKYNTWFAKAPGNKHIGIYLYEDEAAKARDIFILKFNYTGYALNFPELENKYLNNEITILSTTERKKLKYQEKTDAKQRNKEEKKQKHILPDIFPSESGDCWFVLIMSNEGIKYFDSFKTEQEAIQAHKNKLLESNL